MTAGRLRIQADSALRRSGRSARRGHPADEPARRRRIAEPSERALGAPIWPMLSLSPLETTEDPVGKPGQDRCPHPQTAVLARPWRAAWLVAYQSSRKAVASPRPKMNVLQPRLRHARATS